MRLLDTATLKVVLCSDRGIPPYAILSHTWGEEEITLQDLEGGSAVKKKGFAKIQHCCAVAEANGFQYVWIDTCCIDKTSSAELSEAINSMYYWYEEAEVCYAYLADVTNHYQFKSSKWFTRGWTLQELIAPSHVIFFNGNWIELGTKNTLEKDLADSTGIPIKILAGGSLEDCSIAQRMSWAATRETSRIEDIAYSLMGIFGIHMPLIYGEREAAFIRLQEEIMKVSDDQSLLAWQSDDDRGGILATSPRAFASSGNFGKYGLFNAIRSPWTVSSRGVHMDLPFLGVGPWGLGLAILNLTEISQGTKPIAIYLRDIDLTMNIFRRERSGVLEQLDMKKYRPSQYPIRNICVQMSRLRKRGRSEDARIYSVAVYAESDLSRYMHYKDPNALLTAARNDETCWVWMLLTQANVDVNETDVRGRTALWHAASECNTGIVAILLARKDVKVNQKDVYGSTPLFQALNRRLSGVVHLLLRSGKVDLESRHEDGRPILFHAVKHENPGIVHLLLEYGADPVRKFEDGTDSFYYAVSNGNWAILSLFLAHGICINEQGYLNYAASEGHKTCVRRLLDHGADIENPRNDQTALICAVRAGHADVVRLLLERGANFEYKDGTGRSPLIHAIDHDLYYEHRNKAVVRLLLEKGANVEASCEKGRTPLMWATVLYNPTVERLLVDHGASTEAQDKEGRTALMYVKLRGQRWRL